MIYFFSFINIDHLYFATWRKLLNCFLLHRGLEKVLSKPLMSTSSKSINPYIIYKPNFPGTHPCTHPNPLIHWCANVIHQSIYPFTIPQPTNPAIYPPSHTTQTRSPSTTPPKPDLHLPLHPNQISIHHSTQTRPPSRTTGSRSPRLHPPWHPNHENGNDWWQEQWHEW